MIHLTTIQHFIEAIEQGNSEQIEQLIDSFLLNAPPNEQYELMEIFLQYGYLQEADRLLENLAFLYPEEAQIAIDRATVKMELGEEDVALEYLLTVPQHAEEYPQALLALADYYQMQGFYEVAERYIQQSLELLPNEPLLQFAKAELLMETGRFTEAIRLYEQLHHADKTIAGVSLAARLAEAYRSGAAYEKALAYYMKALEEEMTADLLFGSAYAAFQVKNYETVIQQLEDLKELDPDYFSAYLLLAESYAMLEENNKAYQVIQLGLTRDEYDKALFLFAGKIALKIGLEEEAVQHLQQAIALDPEYMEAILVLMSIFEKQERFADMIQLHEYLQQQQFEWNALYPFVARAYNKDEQFNKAYEFYQRAYNDFNEDVLFLEEYCYFLLEDSKRLEAKQVAARLVELQPTEEQWVELYESFE